MAKVWLLQNLDTNEVRTFPDMRQAIDAASRMVGNRAFSGPVGSDSLILMGPGDGTTSVMIRHFEESLVRQMFGEELAKQAK